MKAFIVTVLVLLLAIVIVWGNIYWNAKNSEYAPTTSINNSKITKETTPEINTEFYLKLAANWPLEAKEKLKIKLDHNDAFKIILIGSNAISNNSLGLEDYLIKELAEKYENHIEIKSIVYNKTTTDYIRDSEVAKLTELRPDMVVFEPFLLNDNNVVAIPDTISNIQRIIEETKKVLPDISFILQPPNQIYDANLYPMQVAALQNYANEKNIPYLNHWEVWPSGNDIAVEDYLNANGRPNESGYKLWSEYLSAYFISK